MDSSKMTKPTRQAEDYIARSVAECNEVVRASHALRIESRATIDACEQAIRDTYDAIEYSYRVIAESCRLILRPVSGSKQSAWAKPRRQAALTA